MSDQEYLTFLGYKPVTEWVILKKEEAKPYLELQGHQNACYSASDPKGISLYGKGAKIVKRVWKEKHDEANKSNSEIKEEIETKAPAVSPPPPPLPPSVKEEVVIEETDKENTSEYSDEDSKVLEIRLDKLESLGVKINREQQTVSFKEGAVDFSKVLSYPNKIWIEIIKKYSFVSETVQEVVVEKNEPAIIVSEKIEEKIQKESIPAVDKNSIVVIDKKEDKGIDKNETEKVKDESLSVSKSKDFFQQLDNINFQQLNISINKLKNDKFSIVVKPVNFSGDPAYDNIRPLTIEGTPEELDKDFINSIQKPIEIVNGLIVDAKEFIDNAEALKKKTKAKKETKEKIISLVTAAEKYQKEKFDLEKKSSVTTLIKKWKAVLELDSKNKKALDSLKDLEPKGTLELKEK